MQFHEEFDLFLAYYGDSVMGTEQAARRLYLTLTGAQLPGGRSLRCYFHPITNPEGMFEETPMIVARTPLFLLVVDQGVPRTPAGQLQQYRDDGKLRNLYEEVRSFHNSNMYKEWGGDNAAKLYITDDFDFKLAEQLHPMFSGKTALKSKDGVISWISNFFTNIQPKRNYQKYRAMAQQDRTMFYQGDWCTEAERDWRASRYEPLGRLLLGYYAAMAQRGSSGSAGTRGRQLYQELSAIRNPSSETKTLLSKKEIYRILFYT